MKILVINAGSSSLKYQLIDMTTNDIIAKGLCERIAIKDSMLTHKANGKEYVFKKDMPDHKVAVEMVLDALVSKECGVLKSMDEIAAVGHRVLHGGEDYSSSVLVDDDVIKACIKNAVLGPLHNPANVAGIKACQAVMPNTPMVAVFDTAFHQTMPQEAYLYGVSYDDYKKYHIRKYGFHGTSHMYVSGQAIKYLGIDKIGSKIITCHLGNGSSICAVKDGKCVDTSMGLTPLDGVPMGTRSGSLDPAVVEFYMAQTGADIHQALNHFNRECGMLGLSNNSSDFRDLINDGAIEKENNRRAVDKFAYCVKRYVGEYAFAMNGVDAIVFTAGVGENTPYVRQKVCENLDCFGIKLCQDKNLNCPRNTIADISSSDSKVRILVIPTNEELVIAQETVRVAKI